MLSFILFVYIIYIYIIIYYNYGYIARALAPLRTVIHKYFKYYSMVRALDSRAHYSRGRASIGIEQFCRAGVGDLAGA